MKQARARRSVPRRPAANAKAMAKAGSLDCDAIIFDLEDAVAPAAKSDARDALKAHFADQPICAKERIIRINAMATTRAKTILRPRSPAGPTRCFCRRWNTPSNCFLCAARSMRAEPTAYASGR